MKLCPHEITLLHDCCERLAIVGSGDRCRPRFDGIAVQEIKPCIIVKALDQRALTDPDSTVPAHVRHGTIERRDKLLCSPGNDSEAFGIVLGRCIEKQLHAEADAEQRLLEPANYAVEAEFPKLVHTVSRRADTGQDQPAGGPDGSRVRGQFAVGTEPLQRKLQRSDVRAAAVDDGDCRH